MNIQEQNRILPGYVWPLCRGEKILSVLVDVPERGAVVLKETKDFKENAMQVWIWFSFFVLIITITGKHAAEKARICGEEN